MNTRTIRSLVMILTTPFAIAAQAQTAPRQQGLECQVEQTIDKIQDGRKETERKSGSTTLSIDFAAKKVTDANGFAYAAEIADDLIRYRGNMNTEVGEGAYKTTISVRVSGTLNRINGALNESKTVSAGKLFTDGKTIGQCTPQARRF